MARHEAACLGPPRLPSFSLKEKKNRIILQHNLQDVCYPCAINSLDTRTLQVCLEHVLSVLLCKGAGVWHTVPPQSHRIVFLVYELAGAAARSAAGQVYCGPAGVRAGGTPRAGALLPAVTSATVLQTMYVGPCAHILYETLDLGRGTGSRVLLQAPETNGYL